MGEQAQSERRGGRPVSKDRGQSTEEMAARYLEAKGYQVLARNWRTRLGEVDLIVQKALVLAFVEVRYRRSAAFGAPEETVTKAKRRKVILAALEYAGERGLLERRAVRFDVVAVVKTASGPRVLHIEDAFDADLSQLRPPAFTGDSSPAASNCAKPSRKRHPSP